MNMSNLSLAVLTLMAVVSFSAFPVSGHGRLYEPPARSTMWRRGFNTPINYDDNQLYCGGFAHQVSLGYKCGVCGDPYDGERLHEAGGLYATGTIARSYRQGQEVVFAVDLTANHKGYFEFRICATNSPDIKATQECLDQNLLVLDNSGETRHYIDFIGSNMVNITVRLPAHLTCDFCVVQWRYHTGNSWGTDPDGTSCLGCGHQEEFYGCADVSVLADGNNSGSSELTSSSQPSTSTTASTTTTTTATTTPEQSTTAPSLTPGQSTTTSSSTSISGQSMSMTTSSTTSTTTPADGQTCRSHSGDAGLNQWCANNCAAGFCPDQLCTCDPGRRLVCVGIGAFSNSNAMRKWCLLNCGMGYCPIHLCSCSYVPVHIYGSRSMS